jgi:hypothetical protein
LFLPAGGPPAGWPDWARATDTAANQPAITPLTFRDIVMTSRANGGPGPAWAARYATFGVSCSVGIIVIIGGRNSGNGREWLKSGPADRGDGAGWGIPVPKPTGLKDLKKTHTTHVRPYRNRPSEPA